MNIVVLTACQDPDRGGDICRTLGALAASEGFACRCCDSADLVPQAALMRPDVVLAEVGDTPGTQLLLRQLRRVSPETRVLLVTGIPTQDLAATAIRGGASGILCGWPDPPVLASAVRAAATGGAWFDAELLYRTLHALLHAPALAPAPVAESQLTHREEEVLALIGDGLSNKEIARRLAISDTTVKTYLHRIYVKLNRSGRYKAYRAKPKGGVPSGWGPLA